MVMANLTEDGSYFTDYSSEVYGCFVPRFDRTNYPGQGSALRLRQAGFDESDIVSILIWCAKIQQIPMMWFVHHSFRRSWTRTPWLSQIVLDSISIQKQS